MSAAVPGLGELYTKQYSKAGIFLCTEMLIIYSYLRFDAQTQWAINSYEQFAYSKVGIPLNSSSNYYQLIQNYYSSDQYNEGVYMDARNYYLSANSPYYDPETYEEYLANHLIPPDQEWDWQNNANWMEYRERRGEKQDLEIYSKFTIAAALINRIVSVLDTFISSKRILRDQRKYGQLSVLPDWKQKGFIINYEIKF